jgi:hypothetical protein
MFRLRSMVFSSHFIVDPPIDYLPSYRIGPFVTADVAANATLSGGAGFDDFRPARFMDRDCVLTRSGKEAIGIALREIGVERSDCVTIMTTTGNRYISKCVTQTIEGYCSWSMSLETNTKVILVNHEFGFPYERLSELRKLGVPIIEDCCHSFSSNNRQGTVGQVGDFAVYSFPKFFPIQIGGLLVCGPNRSIEERDDDDFARYVRRVVSHHLPFVDRFSEARRRNWQSLADLFARMGLMPRFTLEPHHTPGVFMFRTPQGTDLQALRAFVNRNGIQSSAFFGEGAYFVPVHHRLTEQDMLYFAEVVKAFLGR